MLDLGGGDGRRGVEVQAVAGRLEGQHLRRTMQISRRCYIHPRVNSTDNTCLMRRTIRGDQGHFVRSMPI